MKRVTLAVFNSPAEAEPLRNTLIAAGIPAEVNRESRLDELMNFSRPSAGVRIEVARNDFEAALQLVNQLNAIESGLNRRDSGGFDNRAPL